jgi:hypothetical protein
MNIFRKWEEFPVGPSGAVSGLHVSLNRKGEILIGARTFRKFGEPEQVLLLFDRRNKSIGIVPTTPKATNCYPLIEKKNGGHRVIRANLFCRHYGINADQTIVFNTAEIDEDGVLVLNLNEYRYVVRPRLRAAAPSSLTSVGP